MTRTDIISDILAFFKRLFKPLKNNNIVIQSDKIGQHMPNTNPEFFTLKELVFSQTAKDKGIDNIPDWDIVDNLKYLGTVLDDLRQAYGKPITVTSGYRCDALNKIVGGVKNSEHRLGLAADCRAKDMADFKRFCVDFFKTYPHDFSQVILEKNKTTEWVHIGVGSDKRQIFSLEV